MGHKRKVQATSSSPLLVTVEEAADLLHVSRRKVFDFISDGTLDSVKIGSLRRIKMASIQQLAEHGCHG